MTVRVLEPTSPAPGQPHRLLYVLPVEIGVTSLSSTYSDGLEELRLLGIPNQFNMTLDCALVQLHALVWRQRHQFAGRMESFIINDLIPFGDTFAKGTEIPPRLAIGFSKSGNGVLFLILRHPDVFSAVAAWDSPAQLNNLNTYAPDLQTNFGTQANFNLYNIPSLVASGGAPFTQQNRLWVSGDQGLYTSQMAQLDSQLTAASIPHTFLAGGTRAHSWHSGWLQGAVTALDAVSIVRSNGQPSGVLASGITQTTISLNTDQKATCRFATTAGIPYASMPNLFSTTGGTSHSTHRYGTDQRRAYTSFFIRCAGLSWQFEPRRFRHCFLRGQTRRHDPAGALQRTAQWCARSGNDADESESGYGRECHLPVCHGGRHCVRVDGEYFHGDGGNFPLDRDQRARERRRPTATTCGARTPPATPTRTTLRSPSLRWSPTRRRAALLAWRILSPREACGTSPGLGASMAKNNGAYGTGGEHGWSGHADGEFRSVFGNHLRSKSGLDELGGSDHAGSRSQQRQLLSGHRL